MTKEIIIATEVEKNHKIISQLSKECCNKVEELDEETLSQQKKTMSRQKMKKKEQKIVAKKKVYCEGIQNSRR